MPWTVDRYRHALQEGVLADDPSLELIDGFIVRKDRARLGDDPMTIGDRHRVAVVRLAQTAPAFDPLGCFLQTQQPVSLPPLNEPEPDAAVVRGTIDDYLDHPPGARDVLAVVEVSDSSLSVDLGPKLAAYAAAGIPQYVVALVNDRVKSSTRRPSGTAIATRGCLAEPTPCRSLRPPGLAAAQLLP